jgi:arabinofuranosyltransferase
MSMTGEKSDGERRFSPRLTSGIIWCAAAGLLLWQAFQQRSFFHDDAFISLRYVVHLVQSGELTWNLGERVEGYTNFLQILATAIPVKLGLDPVDAVRLVDTVATGGLILSTILAARRLAPDDPIAVAVGGFLVMSAGPVALWMLGGLEGNMLAAFVACAIAVILPVFQADDRPVARSCAAGMLIGLAYLTRPDALVFGAAIFLSLCGLAYGNLSQRLRSAGLFGITVSAFVLPHVLWRLSYYGDLLPNTFYAKVALPLSQRLAIGASYCVANSFLLPVIPLALVGLVWTIRRKKIDPAVGLIVAALSGYFLYVIWAGGDHMPGARLLVPLAAPASLVVVASLVGNDQTWRRGFGAAAIMLGLAGAAGFAQQPMDPAAFVGSMVGEYIESAWPPGALVALHTAGSTPFYAPQFTFIDMLGLNDRVIAHRSPVPMRVPWQRVPGHARGDGAYVLSRQPAYIIAGPAQGGVVDQPWFLSDVELAESAEFRRCYEAERAEIPYAEDVARPAPERPQPVVFTYYRRICQS